MDIVMPQLGETVSEGTVGRWYKAAGDHVDAGEQLLDIESDKAAMEITAPATGRLLRILIDTGTTVPVGTVLATLQSDSETATPQFGAASGHVPASAPSPAAQVRANIVDVTNTSDPGSAASGPRLSPVVRRLAREHGFDATALRGTGREGRVTRRDALLHIAATRNTGLEGAGQARPLGPDFLPFNRIRRLTAEHMVRSKATSPHVLQAVEVDFNGIARFRAQHAVRWREVHGHSLTFMPFIAHAVCRSLMAFPHLNASVIDNGLRLHRNVDLAIAIDLGPGGLVAPVLRNAQALSVAEISQRIHDISVRAKADRLRPDEYSGGTYTLSNSGTFGTLITAPVINQPQVAILSVDGIRKRPIVIESASGDSIAIRPVGVLAQSFDHRAVDGAYSASFLAELRRLLEAMGEPGTATDALADEFGIAP